MRVLVTGSRDWKARWQVARELQRYMQPGDTLVHGACPSGVDFFAAEHWKHFGPVEAYPADWDRYGKAAGPIRNQHMVDNGADLCLAFPKGKSLGTRGCMKLAREAGIVVVEFEEEPTIDQARNH